MLSTWSIPGWEAELISTLLTKPEQSIGRDRVRRLMLIMRIESLASKMTIDKPN